MNARKNFFVANHRQKKLSMDTAIKGEQNYQYLMKQ